MSPVTERLSTALADRYRIARRLGEGGMATVYLAEDLKHRRQVAIKVLKPELAAVLGAERFVQEITTTAALQHPHILPLFDSGTADGFLFYVMPFIDGETLRAKLDRETQLGIDEAVKITTDVADALDYAHRNGVIHRDIKPENILLHDGRPMVADFGIALAVSAAAGGRMTETGLSLGTPHYMSPEQATAEKEITARSDVYSLASVLYEMLAGEPPHTAGSAQAIIMKIIAESVQPVTQLRKSVPRNVAAAVATALEKLPADRFATAAQFADALRNPHYTSTSIMAGATPGARGGWNLLTIGMATVAVVMTALAAWTSVNRPAPSPRRVLRTIINMPDSVQLASASFGPRVAISADGTRLAFVGYGGGVGLGGRQIWSRGLDQLEAQPVPGTELAHAPFFSPDGKRIAFFTLDPSAVLRVVSLEGRATSVLSEVDLLIGTEGGTWGTDGAVYIGSIDGVLRIPEEGGQPTLGSRSDSTSDEKGHTPTDALPNGRGLIVTVRHTPTTMRSLWDVAVLDLRTGKHRVLMRGTFGRYLAPGYLIVVRADGVTVATPFDPDRLELTGPPVTITMGERAGGRFSDFALSADGTLVHVDQGDTEQTANLVWVDRDGRTTPLVPSWQANFESVSLSPDGNRLAVGVTTREGAEVWIAQLPDGPHARLTTEGPINYRPTWLPNGERVAFRTHSTSTGRFELVAKRADGIGPAELLARTGGRSIATGMVSPDGQWTIYRTDATEGGRGDILGVRVDDTVPVPLVVSPAEERYPTLSPNGRWLAYRSDEGGNHDIWVRPFPNVAEGRWQVSLAGGTEPVWSRSGRELFYLTPEHELAVATVRPEPPFAVQDRRVLFRRPASMLPNIATTSYDVALDDQRFIMIQQQGVRGDGAVTRSGSLGERIILVENWVEELKVRVPR